MDMQEKSKDESGVGSRSVGRDEPRSPPGETGLPKETHNNSNVSGSPVAVDEEKDEVADDTVADTSDEGDGDDADETASQGIATRVLSRLTSRSSIDPGPPPDGGWVAWGQCM